MNSHRNARTTPFSRALIVARRQSGEAVETIAALSLNNFRDIFTKFGVLILLCGNGIGSAQVMSAVCATEG